jgi:hypothetical protein
LAALLWRWEEDSAIVSVDRIYGSATIDLILLRDWYEKRKYLGAYKPAILCGKFFLFIMRNQSRDSNSSLSVIAAEAISKDACKLNVNILAHGKIENFSLVANEAACRTIGNFLTSTVDCQLETNLLRVVVKGDINYNWNGTISWWRATITTIVAVAPIAIISIVIVATGVAEIRRVAGKFANLLVDPVNVTTNARVDSRIVFVATTTLTPRDDTNLHAIRIRNRSTRVTLATIVASASTSSAKHDLIFNITTILLIADCIQRKELSSH